jgi:hypothetical protein
VHSIRKFLVKFRRYFMCDDGCKCCDGCGCIGPQGPQGVPGIQGSQGIQGPSGLNGSNGQPGANGQPGPQGIQGLSGTNGADGQQGPQGQQGATGPMGSQGPMGIQGNQGPVGPTGPMGPTGIQGIQGPSGLNGTNGTPGAQGATGPQGPQGLIGLQGPQGLQGPAGQNCDCISAFLSIYSSTDQAILPLSSPFMENVNIISSPLDFDISTAAIDGNITVLKHGVYQLSWAIDGKLTPPYPFPVPAWSFIVYRNGVGLPGTSSAAFSITPDDLVVHDSAEAILEFFAGDVLKIVNTATMSVNVVSTVVGSTITISPVRFNLNMVKSLP